MPEETTTAPEALVRRNRVMLTVVPATLLIVVAIGGWLWSSRGNVPETQSTDAPRVQATLHLDTFVLNLADPDQRSYLRVGIDLGLSKEMGKSEGGPPVAQVRDTILGVLALARVDDLLTAKGKNKLKEDLLHALQERLPGLGVEEVYFTEFLIQR
ncbi:MAG: flagellar basal body-associated FliL family protein [Acidobacteriia bacterium]|nr:flagellar basal body-associated FliL family protein [Terriglobia bacterium]